MTMSARSDAFNIAEPLHDISASYDMDEYFEARDLAKRFKDAWLLLSPREERVLRLRIINDMTLREVADEFNLTPERIRGIENHALRKLKHPTRAKRFGYEKASVLGSARLGPALPPIRTRKVEYLDVNRPPDFRERVEYVPFAHWRDILTNPNVLVEHEGKIASVYVRGIATDPEACASFGSPAVALFYIGGIQYGEAWDKVYRKRVVQVPIWPSAFRYKDVIVH